MPLRPSEIVQCEACEEYSRLHELDGVKIVGDDDGDEVKAHPKTKVIGNCPHCGHPVDTSRIG